MAWIEKPRARARRLTAVIVLMASIALAACAAPDEALGRVQETGVLRVGMDASFVPFESVAADGTLVGFDVDLARELGRRLGPALGRPAGLEVQFVANLPYDGLYDALAVDRVDVLISALVVNPARMGDFGYSTPYFDAGQVLVVRAGEMGIEGVADLAGLRLAVEFGARGDVEARKWARRLPALTIVSCQTAAEALEQVAAGEADAALVDHVSALAAAGSGELAILGEPMVEEPYAVAVRAESRSLLRALDEALAEMRSDGTLQALQAKWLVDTRRTGRES